MKTQPKINLDRMRINDLLDKSTDNAINKYLNKIIKLFGGNKSLLQYIIKTKLESIYKIISKQHKKHNSHIKNNIYKYNETKRTNFKYYELFK